MRHMVHKGYVDLALIESRSGISYDQIIELSDKAGSLSTNAAILLASTRIRLPGSWVEFVASALVDLLSADLSEMPKFLAREDSWERAFAAARLEIGV